MVASGVFSHQGASFSKNHDRLIAEHLPKLLNGDSGRVLLIGSFDQTRSRLAERYPLVEFEGLCVWNGDPWEEVIRRRKIRDDFDCVVAMHVLEREPARANVLQIISRLLRPGGKILLYIDPPEEDSLDRRIEQHVRNSKWRERVPIIPALSIPEYVNFIEDEGFNILERSPDKYLIYYANSFSAFLALVYFACPRWPVPRSDWDDEMFAGDIRHQLEERYEIIDVPNSPPDFNYWIEDVLPTHYFILQK